jgi:hypothetical protein
MAASFRLEPLEERHREAVRPAAQTRDLHPYDPSLGYDVRSLLRQRAAAGTAEGHELGFVVWHKAMHRSVGMTRYLNIEEPHRKLEIGSTWYEPSVWAARSIPSASCC